MKFDLIKKISILLGSLFVSLSNIAIANASLYQHKDSGLWIGETTCVSGVYGSITSQVNLWTQQTLCQPSPWTAQYDNGGFRLKLTGSNNLCLNAVNSRSIGALMTLYPCTPGDSGQVFSVTPSIGQLKFKYIQSGFPQTCVVPDSGGNGSALRVKACSGNSNQLFIEK